MGKHYFSSRAGAVYATAVAVISVAALASAAHAATTISTNIITDGTLSVTGTSVLTGNVGIAKSTPTYNLDVTGLGHFSGLVDAANFVATSTTATSTFMGGATFATGGGNVGVGTTSPAGKLSVQQGSAATLGLYLAGYANATVDLVRVSTSTPTATSTVFVIAPNGNVGVGTTSPTESLSVANLLYVGGTGTSTFQSRIAIRGDSSSAPALRFVDSAFDIWELNSSSEEFYLRNVTDSANYFALDTNGIVHVGNGVQSTAPANGTISATAAIGTNMTGANLILRGGARTGAGNGGDIVFQGMLPAGFGGNSSGSFAETARLTYAGNLGIGTTSPYAKLSVVGPVVAAYFHATSTTATSTFGGGLTTGSAGLNVSTNGNVGIGTTSPASLLHVSAGASATTTVEFGGQSTNARTCFNVRDALGAATSFFFVGTTIVVEANRCR